MCSKGMRVSFKGVCLDIMYRQVLRLAYWKTNGFPRNGFKMFIYEVRIFNRNQWCVIRTYATLEEAKAFGEILSVAWDIKKTTLEAANLAGA